MATLTPLGLRLAGEAQFLIAEARARRLATVGPVIPDGWDRVVEQTYPALWPPFRVSLPAGWIDLAFAFSEQCQRIAPDCHVVDSKEKYGGMRVDITGDHVPPEAMMLETIYESISETVCQDCGERGAMRADRGWYATLCDKHAVERDQR